MTMALLAAVGMAALPGGTLAKDGDVIRTGSCTGNADWKLKLSPEVRKVTADGAGSDRFVARARNIASGEVCRGTATFA